MVLMHRYIKITTGIIDFHDISAHRIFVITRDLGNGWYILTSSIENLYIVASEKQHFDYLGY